MIKLISTLQPEGERLIEIETLDAFVNNDQKKIDSILDRLNTAGDTTLMLAAWNVGAFSPAPFEATAVADLMAQPERSRDCRTLGLFCKAYLAIAQGRISEAFVYVDDAARNDPRAALELRAYFNLLPFVESDAGILDALQERLASPPSAYEPDSHNIFGTVHNGMHGHITTYLSTLLDIRMGKNPRKWASTEEVMSDFNHNSALKDLKLGALAYQDVMLGNFEEAAQELDGLNLQGWYGFVSTSPFFSRARERYLHGLALAHAGRIEDADVRLRSFTNHSLHDLMYLAPSHYQRGLMYEDRDPEKAAEHFALFLEMWQGADSQFDTMIKDARERLERIRNRM